MPNLTRTIATAPLASKLKSLGMDDDELDVLVQFVRHNVRVPAGADIIHATDSTKYSTLLLAGVACSYKRLEDGSRHIYSFQHPGDFCDLYRYVLPERDDEVAVQALTDCSIGVIDSAGTAFEYEARLGASARCQFTLRTIGSSRSDWDS